MKTAPDADARCSQCHGPLGADGACVACLLRGGLSEETLAASDPGPAPTGAETVYGDFDIARRDDGSLWELGRGAMGVTYKAIDRVLHRPVALKVIQLRADLTRDGPGSDALRERFLREARAAAALRHTNIAGVFHFGASDQIDRCFYVMELVEGETLEARVRRDGPLDVATALEVARQVAAALVAASARGLVHRDLKPGNLMLAGGGGPADGVEVKVIDFGLAKAAAGLGGPGETDLTHGAFVGTPAFASPEQFTRDAIDVRSDLYSLGVTLWYALAGRAPFTGRTLEEVGGHPARQHLPVEQLTGRNVPACVVVLLRRVLAVDPAARTASAREFLGALDTCRRQLDAARSFSTRRRVMAATAAVLTLVVGGMWWGYPSAPGIRRAQGAVEPVPGLAAPNVPEKSVAVLPFENLSADKDNAFFTDGVQDEILAGLARVADLKVIARSSVIRYKSDAPRNLPEIAVQLGVANVLEGSVQRAGNQVRVTVRLIDARTSAERWGEHYDRPLNDVFAIQSEIAEAIAGQLQARLSPAEKKAIDAVPTTDLAAYDLYLRAQKIDRTLARTEMDRLVPEEAGLLEEAVERDPKFLSAWTLLAQVQGYLYWFGLDSTPARLDRFRAAVLAAVRLQPDAGETHLALAGFYYHGYRDYARALAELDLASRSLPNNSEIYAYRGYIQHRQGRQAEAIRNLERALELDPRNFQLLQQVALNYPQNRDYAGAVKTFQRMLAIVPGDPATRVDLAALEIAAHADMKPFTATMAAVLAENPRFFHQVADLWYSILERDPATAERYLACVPPTGSIVLGTVWPRAYREALVARLEGDDARARSCFTTAREEVQKTVAAQPDLAIADGLLGLIDAGLGRKEEAISEGRRACELLPVEKDHFSGGFLVVNLAQILAWTGEKTAAVEQLETVTVTSEFYSYGQLKLNPAWDSLRGDPRFEALVASLAPVASPAAPVALAAPEKSVAVLPFENLSSDKENAFFADGVQDEILTDLAKVADLKVISRTSVMQYRGARRNLPEIGRALGVAFVVEGSVQRAGNKIRVIAQLIDARTDAHRWAETYDRDLADVFAIQSEIAKVIAGQLQAAISPQEHAAMLERPTASVEAYAQYVRGKQIVERSLDLEDQRAELLRAVDLLDGATRRDPAFVDAYCLAARAHDLLYHYGLDATPARRALAETAVNNAVRLRADAGEVHLARADFYFHCDHDYARAGAELALARPGLPNSAELYLLSAVLDRHLGRWDDSIRELEKARELDPRSTNVIDLLGDTYVLKRQFAAAARLCEPSARPDLDPRFSRYIGATFSFAETGGTQELAAALRELPGYVDPGGGVTPSRIIAALAVGDYPGAYAALSASPLPAFQDVDFSFYYPRAWYEAQIARAAGDEGRARTAFAACRKVLEERLTGDVREPRTLAVLAQVDAGLGNGELALAEARHAVELMPISRDAYDGPLVLQGLAQVEVWTGDHAGALDAVETLVRLPGYLTYGYLLKDPLWAPLHGDPRFEALVASLAPKR